MTERLKRKIIVGTVTSDKMAKTIVVSMERLVKHPKYGKYMKRYTVFKAHDEKREARTGDVVEIMETRPISRTKRWRLVRIVRKGEGVLAPIPGAPELEAPKPEPPAPEAPKPEAPKAEAPASQS
jgi:small subunit ribosomal protein S17